MEIGSLAAGGYGLIKGGIKGVQLVTLSRQMEKFAGELALNEIKFVPKDGVGQIWSQTKNRTSVQNAYKHWKDHGHEFSDIQNAKQYVEKAHNLFSDPNAASRIRADGCVLCYDPYTNVFGSYSNTGVPNSNTGVPKTLFKPGMSKPLPSR